MYCLSLPFFDTWENGKERTTKRNMDEQTGGKAKQYRGLKTERDKWEGTNRKGNTKRANLKRTRILKTTGHNNNNYDNHNNETMKAITKTTKNNK